MAIGRKLNPTLRAFIERQPLFFVATAGREGRVNLSPKGLDTLRIVDDARIVWLNLTGSGNETAAHLRDINRMTLMFCAFDGEAMILRVYGSAMVLHPRDEGWATASAGFPVLAGSRQPADLRSVDRSHPDLLRQWRAGDAARPQPGRAGTRAFLRRDGPRRR
ncbi:MAG: pyridoxamine 5'-phosphate oxidase family protein [Pseudomonadota bacterium]